MATALGLIVAVVAPNGSAAPWRLTALLTAGDFKSGSSLPFGGRITCPSAATCYAVKILLSARGANPSTNVSLSSDGGATWRDLALPGGLVATSALSCSS